MKTSSIGRALIAQREGLRLSAYRDTRGIWTIGVGHTGRMSPPPVVAGQTITEAQCDVMLATDLAPVEHVIATAVTVPISQNEFDAMASLGFNIGAPGLARSSVVRKLNAGDIDGASAAFMDWSKPVSLAGRRREEAKQFLSADAGGASAHEVTASRADVLSAKAEAKRRSASSTTKGAVVTAAVGAVATIGTATSSADPHLWTICAAVVAIGVAIDGVAALVHRAAATTLTTNAAKQAATAAVLAPVGPANPATPATTIVSHV